MMTDRERLEKIRVEVMSFEEGSYVRMKKKNVLEKLIVSADMKTGKLSQQIIIPKYEHDIEFLKKTLGDLGYTPTYEEEFNHFYGTTSYKVTL